MHCVHYHQHGRFVQRPPRLIAQSSPHLDRIGVSCDLLITSQVVGSFDELALLEPGAGADECD